MPCALRNRRKRKAGVSKRQVYDMSGVNVIGGIKAVFRAGVFALAAIITTLSVVPASAQSISVSGNRRVDTETIRSFVTLAPGDSYTPARIDQAIKDLYATGLFSDVRVRRAGSGIAVSVVENSLINRVSFVGNSKVKTEILTGEIQSRSRGPFSQSIVDQDVSRIRDIYARAGRAEASVNADIAPQADGRVDVTFRIREGGKTGVAEIRFQGNSVYSASKLRGVMSTTESNFLSFLKSSDVYDPERIAADLEAVRRFYLRNGYADFRVVNSSADLDASRNGYVISITVEEGPRYSVASVDVESRIADVDTDRLRGVVHTRSGNTYDAQDVEKSVDAISREVARRGYAFAQVRPRGDRDPASRTVRIVYSVEEGPRVYVERIVVRGNTRTRDYVIRREFDLGEGDAYNKAAVDRAERRLNNLGFFKKVKITNEPGSAPDRVIVLVDVEDQATGSFSIAGGYSTSDGFIAEISLQETNFLGRGQYVRVSGSNGQKSRGAEFSFTEPFFMGYRIAAGFDLYTKFSDVTTYTRYQSRTNGFSLRAGVPITEEFSVGARYSLYAQQIKIPNTATFPYNDCAVGALGGVLAPCIANGEAGLAIKEARGKLVTSLAGLTFAYNTLDNVKDPTSGIYADLKPEVAGLGGDSRYFRAVATARYYYPITDDIIGMIKAQGGFMQGFGNQKLKVIDHFNLGPDLVRGFAPSGIGPRDRGGDAAAGGVGGTTYLGLSAEITFPIFGLPRELGLRGAIFADAGTLFGYRGRKIIDANRDGLINGLPTAAAGCGVANLAQSECLSVRDDRTIRSSIGAGLLWASPLGPIRMDYAYAITRMKNSAAQGAGDRLQGFRFSGGARF